MRVLIHPTSPTAPAHNRGFFISIGPSGTAADSATVVRPAGLGNGWPPDAGTCCPGASRTRDRPAFAQICPLARFSARSGVLAPGEPSDAVNSLSRGMSWVFGDCHSLGLGSFERYVDE